MGAAVAKQAFGAFLAVPRGERLGGVDRILGAIRHHLGMEIAFASRIAGGRRTFTHIHSDLPLPYSPGDGEPFEDTLCQRILAGRLPELMHDAAEHAAARELPLTSMLPVGSHLNVPLTLSDGRLYGTFCCVSRTPDRTLGARDLDTLRAFAELAAEQIEAELDETADATALRTRIDGVLRGRRLRMHYQPIHRLADGVAVGVESLARFPDAGERPPNLWFDEAARVGLGHRLERAAVRAALKGLAGLPAPAYLSFNVSPEVVIAGGLRGLLDDVPAGRVVIEVTEHTQVADHRALASALDPYRAKARVAVDDVGAGYAGLQQVLALRPDILKLDMALVRDVDRDPARRALAAALVGFSREIGADIVAEGIEREGERDALRTLGVALGQGFWFSRPLPLPAAQRVLLGQAVAEATAERRTTRARAA